MVVLTITEEDLICDTSKRQYSANTKGMLPDSSGKPSVVLEGQQQSGDSSMVLHVSCYLVNYLAIVDLRVRCCGFLLDGSASG